MTDDALRIAVMVSEKRPVGRFSEVREASHRPHLVDQLIASIGQARRLGCENEFELVQIGVRGANAFAHDDSCRPPSLAHISG